MDNSASSAFQAVLAALSQDNFAFPPEFKLSPKESEVLKLVITYSVKQKTYPQFSSATDYVQKHGVNPGSFGVYMQQLKQKGLVDNSKHRKTWEFSSKVTKCLPQTESSSDTGTTESKTTPQEPSDLQPVLEGKFKELWDFLTSRMKGNEVVLNKDGVAEATKLLKCEDSFIWDTVRRFESRGLIKRSRTPAGIVLTRLMSPPKDDAKAGRRNKARVGAAQSLEPAAPSAPGKGSKQETQPVAPAKAAQKPQALGHPKGDMSLQSFKGIVEQELSALDADITRLETKLAAKKTEREQKAVVLKSLENYL